MGKAKPVAKEADRTKIPTGTKRQLLMEAGYKCGNPACPVMLVLEFHHIEYVCDGGGDGPDNLLVLCPNCHTMHHSEKIPVDAIRFWKGLLLSLNQAFDRESLDLLRYLNRVQKQTVAYSGDGILRFARQIGMDLVGIDTTEVCEDPLYKQLEGGGLTRSGVFTRTSHRVKLTEKGQLLLDAWMGGDAGQYQTIMSNPPFLAPSSN